MKEKIAKLKISGQVFIWKYSDNTRNYPGWNLTVDKLASEELSTVFDMMGECKWSTSKTVRTSKPMETEIAVPNNRNGNDKWSTKPAILFCADFNLSPHHWVINEMPASLEIHFGKQNASETQRSNYKYPKWEWRLFNIG